MPQLLDAELFRRKCLQKGTLCAIALVPHILDTGADGRNGMLASLRAAAKKNRRSPVTFLWSDGAQQPALEDSLGGFGAGYHALVALSGEKARVATMREAFDEKHSARAPARSASLARSLACATHRVAQGGSPLASMSCLPSLQSLS